jgi:4-hydroxythreonine-4-phosphate dehydrogenase
MKPRIAVSMGDFNGIGPEVILKALKHIDFTDSIPVLIGHEDVFQFYDRQVNTGLSFNGIANVDELSEVAGVINLINISDEQAVSPVPGEIESTAGLLSMLAVEKGIGLCLSGDTDALVTAPISKEAVHKAGYPYPGHTEFLAAKSSTKAVQMILVNDALRVALATIHIPVKDILSYLSTGLLEKQIDLLDHSLKSDFGIQDPHIAVLGLNPHAGDGGVIGTEEPEIIQPAIDAASRRNILVKGPFPADGFFGNQAYKNYDAILAMYHDQGMIPFKTLSFGSGVNFTAGLPFIRTSPDHGTGYDIAGKNRASELSFRAAYELAVKMVMNKATSDERYS